MDLPLYTEAILRVPGNADEEERDALVGGWGECMAWLRIQCNLARMAFDLVHMHCY